MSKSLEIAATPQAPDDTAPAARITVEDFRDLLHRLHPFSSVLGIEILDIQYGQATLRLPPSPANQRLGGIVAGPMLMGLADLALYAAVVSATGVAESVTASLTINFLRGAPASGIVAQARILKTGRMTAGEVLLLPEGGGEPVAQVISTWSVPRKN
ncbi:MAG: PaaI family thioesterase [Castellaniella sp.]|uniref:PaaI family thioesterase n=1 Tax=Castellaniella sp. TaxID=1955812 RepID=UPI002A371911|nr:PaaI family thioesterase [Castellaniella sp.]MDY0309209.1 PaaI family thioesterase [Castellaniella sp.]